MTVIEIWKLQKKLKKIKITHTITQIFLCFHNTQMHITYIYKIRAGVPM